MKDLTLLNEYAESEITRYRELLEFSSQNIPYTISHPFIKYCENLSDKNYGSAMNHALDFCEISIQYISTVLITILCNEEDRSQLQQLSPIVNKIDSKRPLSFGDWVNDIFVPLVNIATKVIPDNPLVISIKKNVMINKRNIITGSERVASFVQIRNEYKGHSTTLSQNIYKGVVYTMESRLWQLLEAMRPLGAYLFFSPTEVNNQGYRVKVCNGDKSDLYNTISIDRELNIGDYYLCADFQGDLSLSEAKQIYNMSPLVWCNEQGYIYVFQTLKEEDITYISSNEEAVTIKTEIFNDNFDLLFQQIVPSFDISKDLNWSEYIQILGGETKRFIESTYREKKYNKELFVDRKELSTYFSEFIVSDKLMFPILGEAGQGKTNQLCYWTEHLLGKGECIATFNCNNFSNYTLDHKIRNIFAYSHRKPIKKLIDRLHCSAVAANKSIYLIFDAINECLTYKDSELSGNGALDLYREIRKLFIDGDYTNFKVIFTCRSYTWKHLIKNEFPDDDPKIFLKDDEEFAIQGFTDEELERAYKMYQELYQIENRFEEIDRSIVLRLKDPLMLKMACTNYLGSYLPNDSSAYSSISLFSKMFLDISKSYAGRKQCAILDKVSEVLLYRYKNGQPSDSIDVNELHSAYYDKTSKLNSLASDIFTSEGQTVAYGELLHKPERPVLRVIESESMTKSSAQQQYIQFIYERFLEYVLAKTFLSLNREKIESDKAIPADIYKDELNSSNLNVVFLGAMRNAILIDYMHTKDPSTIIELAENRENDYENTLLINEVLNVMVRENYESDLFLIIRKLMEYRKEELNPIVLQYNKLNELLEKNKIEDNTFGQLQELQTQIAPLIKLRQMASVTIVNGIFQSDYFNEGLYKAENNPYSLLWEVMCDTLDEVRNSTALYIYYLSNVKYTLGHSVIKENLAESIIIKMFDNICKTPITLLLLSKNSRKRATIFLETAIRIAVILIIDTIISQTNKGYENIAKLMKQIERVLRHFSGQFYLIRIVMPFFQIIMRRQIIFQAAYVNNAIEYQMFWDDKIISKSNSEDMWSRDYLGKIMPYVLSYNLLQKQNEQEELKHLDDFQQHHKAILHAYTTGDSLSYFVLERILIVQGVCKWSNIREVIIEFFSEKYRKSEWFDYSQMSMLYILFQITQHSQNTDKEVYEILYRECEDWMNKCKGVFTTRNSHKANPYKNYKRNVLSWYAAAYCCQSGRDNLACEGDERCVPIFYKSIKNAFDNNDKELLYNCIENITESICDYNLIETGLELTKYIYNLFDEQSKIDKFDAINITNRADFHKGLVKFLGESLAAAKKYFPIEVDSFIKKDIVGLSFPGINKYREEILNYNTGGETIADLMTHKFGKFLIFSLIREESVDNFAIEAMNAATNTKNCFEWYDSVVRIVFRHLFKVKI